MITTLLYPIASEKATALAKHGKYIFVVERNATKIDVKNGFKQLYGVPAVKVNVIHQPGKKRLVGRGRTINKRRQLKKVIITTKSAKSIDVYKV